MMEIALGLVACAVFAALAAVAITAALESARVDDVIGEVFSPWIHDPFGASDARTVVEPSAVGDQAPTRPTPGPDAVGEDRERAAARL